ncbi:FAD binding domain-containing protein [Anaeromyxobacter oryzae]|uniref:Carbon monoxide dehydrogenase n=1 Tax=Anaeromyxobacter oryzae TaxID=2918170 RepID=A0ABM7X2Z4_9BACT|nr:xanthine dehydrogenase family protein subunit M [Anaeromyxobacter oryzae]BDG06162.1 carbon monoxide dehydrogenase [Anaeromyxobacter oryzae]
MQDFTFHRAESVADAVAKLRARPEGKLLGGGQSLIPVMKLGLAAPTDVVSLAGLAELRGVRVEGKELVIGAATTHADVADSAEVRGAIPALADLAAHIGDPQVRNRGTLGGSLAHNDPAADYPAAVLALGATIVTDRRRIPADAWFQGLFATALEPDEVIVAVRFPIPEKAAYAKLPHPASKFALVGVMVAKGPAGVRVAVTGAGAGVFRAEALERALAARFAPDALAGSAVPADGLTSDPFGSAEYRAHLVGVLARRAVAACGQGGGGP